MLLLLLAAEIPAVAAAAAEIPAVAVAVVL